MLAEQLLEVDGLQIIQCNTDGLSLYFPRINRHMVDDVSMKWQKTTKLELEQVEYSKMFVRDVNNYIAVKLDGSTKRKGAYEWDKEWHQDQSALVVPKVAEMVLVHGAPVRETVENWPDKMDFMCRVKVNKGSSLILHQNGVDRPLDTTQRYYVSKGGGQLFKRMPPLARTPTVWRRNAIESGWTVCPCNDIRDATLPIDHSYYIREIEKLTLGVM